MLFEILKLQCSFEQVRKQVHCWQQVNQTHCFKPGKKYGVFPITCQSQKISPCLKSGPGTYTGASSGICFCIDALRTCSWVQQWWNLPQGSQKYTYPQFFCFILWQCLVPTSAAKDMHVRTFEDCPWNHCVSDFSEQSKFICVWITTRTYFLFWLVWNMNFIFHHIWDVIPTPLTLTPSFFKMVIAPPTRSPHDSSIQDDLDVETVPKNASVRAIERWGDDPPIRAFFSGDRRYRMGRAVSWMSCQTSKRR